MLYPTPVVVDADVLIRDVQYMLKAGHLPRRLRSASGEYSVFTGVTLFATQRVFGEAIRHLPDAAERAGVSEAEGRAAWNRAVVPRLRVVDLDDDAIDDPRVAAVRKLHVNDAPTAALAALLAPAVLLTDNRKHFAPFALPKVKSDAVAGDAVTVSELGVATRAAMLAPTLSGVAIHAAAKKITARFGTDVGITVGMLAAGGAGLFLMTERGRSMRARAGDLARTAGPPLASMAASAVAAGERLDEFAIDRVDEPDALAVVARRLAVGRPVMTTQELVEELRIRGFGFKGSGRFETQARAWIAGQSCFHELRRGHWTLGYHAAALRVRAAN